MPLSAAVFDMDGTLVDSERIIMGAWLAASEQAGRALTHEDYAQVIGLNEQESNVLLTDLLGGVHRFEAVRRTVRQRLSPSPSGATFPLKPGVRELLGVLQARGIPCAVASSSSRAEIEDRLTRTGILSCFQAAAGGDEVPRGKPDPAVYHLAAARLGIAPAQCLAFEDSSHGATAALAAGMQVILVPDLRRPEQPVEQAAMAVLDSLAHAVDRVGHWFAFRAA